MRQLLAPSPSCQIATATLMLHDRSVKDLMVLFFGCLQTRAVSVLQLLFICNKPTSIEPSPFGLLIALGLQRDSRHAMNPNVLGGSPAFLKTLWNCGQSLTGSAATTIGVFTRRKKANNDLAIKQDLRLS